VGTVGTTHAFFHTVPTGQTIWLYQPVQLLFSFDSATIPVESSAEALSTHALK